MKGAPKIRAAMRRRGSLGGSAGRFCYRLCYILLVVAAVAAVVSRFRGAPVSPVVLHSTTGQNFGGFRSGSSLAVTQESAPDPKQEHLRRWIVKPNSLCFGKGNITIMSVAIDLPQVHGGSHVLKILSVDKVRGYLSKMFMSSELLSANPVTVKRSDNEVLQPAHISPVGMTQAYLELLRSNRLAYAGIHNYRYCEVGTVLDFARHPHWTKVKATALLLSFADTVMHIDADALIVNHSISVESIIESTAFNISGKDAIYTTDFKQRKDAEVDARSSISSAVYIMRSTSWSKALLEAEHKFYRESSLFNKYEEQDALNLYRMKHLEEYAQHVGIVPFRLMNSPCSENYNFYEPGDFIAHFVEGRSPEKYLHLASSFLSKSPHEKSCSTCECFLEIST